MKVQFLFLPCVYVLTFDRICLVYICVCLAININKYYSVFHQQLFVCKPKLYTELYKIMFIKIKVNICTYVKSLNKTICEINLISLGFI